MASDANIIDRVLLELSTDDKGLDEGIKKGRQAAKDLGKDFAEAGAVISGIGLAIVGSFGAMVKSTASYGDEIDDARQKTGLTATQLTKLKFAADQNEASFEDLQTSLKLLAKNMTEANKGGKEQQEMFARLGVSTKDQSGHSRALYDVFLDIADAFQKMPDEAAQSTASLNLLGRSGTNLIPTLNLGRAGLAAMGDQAQRLGVVLDDETAKAAGDFDDTLAQVETAMQGVSIRIAQALIPDLKDTASAVRDDVAAFSEWTTEHGTLVRGVGALGLALVGAGGLLLAIGGIIAILPTAAAGLGVVTAAAGLLGGAFLALGPGGIAVAMAALVALTYKIGESTGAIDALAGKIGQWTGATKAVEEANRDLGAATQRLADDLSMKYGITIDRAGRSIADWNAEVVKVAKEHDPLIQKQKEAAEAALANEARIEAQREATAKLNTSVREIIDSFSKQTDNSAALEIALKDLETQHVSSSLITKRLGDDINTTAQALRDSGQVIPPLIQKYADLANAEKQRAYEIQAAVDEVLADTKHENEQRTYEYAAAVAEVLADEKHMQEERAYEIDAALKEVLADEKHFNDERTADINAAVDEVIADHKREKDEQKYAIDAVVQEVEEAAKRQKKAHDEIRDSAGHIFDDMLIKGKSVFSSLGDLLKGGALSIGRSIFQDVTAALLGPVKAVFDDFFQKTIGTMISNLLGGLGKSIAGLISGALGSAGAAAAGAGGAAAGAGGAAAGAGGAGGLGALGAFMTNPWTIGVAAAVAGVIAILKSQAHHEANTWVKEVQNPFGTALSGIVDAFDMANASGTLTLEQAQSGLAGVQDLWAQYKQKAEAFAAKGSDERKVIDQSYQTLAFVPGTTIPKMQAIIAQMQNQGTTPAPAPAPNPAPNPGPNMSDGAWDRTAGEELTNMVDLQAAVNAGHNVTVRGTPVGGKGFMGGLLVGSDASGWETLDVALGGSWNPAAIDALMGAGLKIGSFEGGIDYVPYPRMLAEIHEGEAVLTKQENAMRGGIGITFGDVILAGISAEEEADQFMETFIRRIETSAYYRTRANEALARSAR